jgi:hypothetical protein
MLGTLRLRFGLAAELDGLRTLLLESLLTRAGSSQRMSAITATATTAITIQTQVSMRPPFSRDGIYPTLTGANRGHEFRP